MLTVVSTSNEGRPAHSDIRIVRVPEMTETESQEIFAIFDASYRQANHEYLQLSLERIGLLALAVMNEMPAGYAISNFRWMDLPGFDEPQLVVLHGMRCVVPQYRHQGLFVRLNREIEAEMRRQIVASGRIPDRQLNCGRYGHASRAGGRADPSAVPRVGRAPTAWQQAVGRAVAEAYGSNLDPLTFVCVGSGTPIGYPNEEFDASEAERAAFAPVNRQRGDNLLVINWVPDSPPGWVDTE